MAKEDLLGMEMGKLEIQPTKPNITGTIIKDDNPFTYQKLGRCVFTRSSVNKYKCPCMLTKKYIKPTISKKKTTKLLREPVLKLLQNNSRSNHERTTKFQKPLEKNDDTSHNLNSDILSLCALVDDCNQLRISSNIKKNNDLVHTDNNHKQWWKNDISHAGIVRKAAVEPSQGSSCSQQALNPPCDVTIDELASYFETLVHIPKKMSSMAEMMYI